MPPGRIRTRDPDKRTAADPRLRPHGHWNRIFSVLTRTSLGFCCSHRDEFCYLYWYFINKFRHTHRRNLIKTHKRKFPIIDTLGKAETLVAKLRFLITWIELNILLFAIFVIWDCSPYFVVTCML